MSTMHLPSGVRRPLATALLAAQLLLPAACNAEHKPAAGVTPQVTGAKYQMSTPPKADELKARKAQLTREQFHVTQEEGTEAPFRNAYWDNHAPGIYVDVVSGEPLFSSKEKFDSGTGWPSFWAPLEKSNVVTRTDSSLFMVRTEVRSKVADSHLGHLFDDGPRPTGQRYCMNSASMRFVPADRLAAEGYGKYAGLFPEVKQVGAEKTPSASASATTTATATTNGFVLDEGAQKAAAANRAGVAAEHEVAVLAGGCFWGMEELLRKQEGVVSTEVGYAGGARENPSYSQVTTGATGHAEAVKIVFDPKRTSFERLVKYYFRIHDPTTLNRQENDVGTQYRSAIFAQTPDQGRVATVVKEAIDKSRKLERPVVTQIVPATLFWKAEDYHQKYLVKHPGGYQCHFERKWEL